MKKAVLAEKKPTYRVSLWGFFLALVFLLSGCSQAFSNNPVVQQIKNGENEFDFSMFDSSSPKDNVEDESKELLPEPQLQIVPEEQQLVFDSFLNKVRNSQNIAYKRTLSFSEKKLITNSPQEDFFAQTSLETIEQKNKFVLDGDENQRALFDGTNGYLINKTDGNSNKVTFGKKDRRHFLSFLADEATLEILSVETETAGDEKYLVFNLTENSQISKWYFNEEGTLFLRMFLDRELLYAMRYDNVEFDISFDESALTLSGYKTPLSKPEEDPATVETSSSESSKPESSAPSSAASEPPKAPASVPPATAPQPAVSSSPSSQPQSSVPSSQPQSSVPSSQPRSSVSGEVSGENLQGNGETTTSSKPAVPSSVAPAPKPPIKEYSSNNVPSDFVNYPTETLPIIYGFNIINSSDVSSGERRTIMMTGTVTGSAIGTASYYEQILEGSRNYKTDELYSEEDGATYYTISARRHAWDIDIAIAEDHYTMKTTLEIKLDR